MDYRLNDRLFSTADTNAQDLLRVAYKAKKRPSYSVVWINNRQRILKMEGKRWFNKSMVMTDINPPVALFVSGPMKKSLCQICRSKIERGF